jgi:hypothetical protein
VSSRARRQAPTIALAATLHDPPGALAEVIGRALPKLQELYRTVAVATSPPTARRVKKLLTAGEAHAGSPLANVRGPLYRLALRRALHGGADLIHYLDFDRALHWIREAPRELRAVLRVARRTDLLLLGRTPGAHRSHHLPLYATEVLANRLVAERLRVRGRLDVLVPSFVVSRDGARQLLAHSRARDLAVYGEWAALVMGLDGELAYLECRGLTWETPDRHPRAVRRAGLPAWRRRQETPAEWTLRIDMAERIVVAFERTLGRRPASPSIRRLPVRAGALGRR